jgi:hypothetical protein
MVKFVNFGCWGDYNNKIYGNPWLSNVIKKINNEIEKIDFFIVNGDNYYQQKIKNGESKKSKKIYIEELKKGFDKLFEVLNNDDMDRRYGDRTAPYGIQINRNRYEDASLVRGVGSIINHKPKAQSNCEFYVSTRDNLVYLRAIKIIRNGHELFVNYGKDYHLHEEGVHTATNHSKYW